MPWNMRAAKTALPLIFLFAVFHAKAMAEDALEIDFEKALELARKNSPESKSSQLRIDEARGRLEGASVLFRENPNVEVGLGPRLEGSSGVSAEAELSQAIEIGGRRAARIDIARSEVDRTIAMSHDATRRSMREAGGYFYRCLHAYSRLNLSERAEEISKATLRVAERRHQAGDIPLLHLNLARAAAARARSDRMAQEAALASALGELRILIGIGSTAPLTLKGKLSDRGRFEKVAAKAALSSENDSSKTRDTEQPFELRPDLQVLIAEEKQAEAEQALGRGLRWPDLAIGIKYSREEPGASDLLGTLRFTLPIFERGQGSRAEAGARRNRLQFELEAARRRVGVEVEAALSIFRKRVEAVAELESIAPMQEQNESLARRSYEMGAIGLAELLVARREALETEIEFLERQLEAAKAGIELEAAIGDFK